MKFDKSGLTASEPRGGYRLPWRRALNWLIGLFAGLVVLVGMLAAALDAGYFQGPLVRFFSGKMQREIRVEGHLQLQLFSRTPRLVAERVTIGNPPWTLPGIAAEAERVSVVFETPRLGRHLQIASISIERATLHLLRDAAGHANWQVKNPDTDLPKGLPVMHALSMMDAHVLLDDSQKHRQFDGVVSAQDVPGADGGQPFRIDARGQLNGRPVSIEFLGDPLRSARRDTHYGFTFEERSSGSRLTGKGELLQPFDVHYFDATFEANGADVKDLYYLTGTKLIDTGAYHLTGKLERRGYVSSFKELVVTAAQSDLQGSVSIEMQRGLTRIDADLMSQSLHLADLGARAAGRASTTNPAEPRLLSYETHDWTPWRHTEATFKFRAHGVQVGRLILRDVAARVTVDRGLASLTPLSADLLGGRLDVQLKLDARKDIPGVDLHVKIDGSRLGDYAHNGTGPPAIEGPLRLRLDLAGEGKSLRDIAVNAEGTIKATLPSGTVRDSLAELTGIDLRGLGLLLTKSKKEVPVRCGVADFQAHNGTLTARNLVLDTEPVLIVGEGEVHLDSEVLDFVLRGYPKSVRFFQLRAPIVIRGTLAHPSVGIQAHDSKLVLVDRGQAKDADCESLLK